MALIPLNGKRGEGLFAIVDDDLENDVNRRLWHIGECGYPKSGAGIRLHRYVWRLRRELIPGVALDHINRDVLDNRLCNLRIATTRENCRNSATTSRATGFKGVYPSRNKFRVILQVDGKAKHFGCFESAAEAARKFDDLVRQLHGEFACTNADMGLL